jgi:hypothetical protein
VVLGALVSLGVTHGDLYAQSPGHAVPTALLSLASGFGGCSRLDSTASITIAAFPTVRFWISPEHP